MWGVGVQEVHVYLHSGRECHYCWHLAPKYNIKLSIVSPLLPDKNSKLIRSPGDYQHTQAPLSHTPSTYPHHIPTVHLHTHHTHTCDGYVVGVWGWSMLSSASEILVSGKGEQNGRYYMYIHVHCFLGWDVNNGQILYSSIGSNLNSTLYCELCVALPEFSGVVLVWMSKFQLSCSFCIL